KKSYTVKAGDGLWTVAQALGTTIDAVKQVNGLSSNLIFPGQVLYAPGNSSSSQNHATNNNSSSNSHASSNTNKKSYTVKAGDGLWTVAQALGTTIDAVKQANGLSSNLIFPGQVLYAPGNSSSTTHQQTTTQSTTNHTTSESGTYTVKAGDTQWRIAQNHGLSLAQLRQLNGLTNANLYVGQVLRVSGSAPTTQTQSHTTTTESQNVKPGVAVGNRTDTTPNTSHQSKTYTVKAGDNLYRIALNHGVSLSALVSANHLGSINALITPGQTLVIPA
ncbi:MAG: LysM peptidoglycan-binding domain-containing protein, partial [Aerococcus sp.]|nr:LysM peptidoglycan-binding domain-containing protein [Aerococcus sp.]